MNSLRRDIHSAFEVITPPLGGMPERVVQTVLADKRRQRKERRMVYRMRFPLALVAAVLLVAVAVGAVVTWNALHNSVSPVGNGALTPLQQLEARPLQTHVYTAASQCKSGPSNAAGEFGSGPIYLLGATSTTTGFGSYGDLYMYTDATISGPILIRARDVLASKVRIVFVGDHASGPIVGTDVVDGAKVQQQTEAVVYEDATSTTATVPYRSGRKFAWHLVGAVPNSTNGVGWQIDAQGFTEIFYSC